MTSDQHNVFDEMETNDAYCIYVTAELKGEGADAAMLLALPMRQVESAPRAKGRAHAFELVADFQRENGMRYQLRGTLAITKR
jgi:hypothetical protein